MPRMLLDRSQIHEMQQRSHRGVNGIVQLAAFLIREPNRLDEGRGALQVLLKKHRRLNPARVALQNCRTVFQKRQEQGTDAQVITKEIEFGELLVRPIDTVKTGKGNALAGDL